MKYCPSCQTEYADETLKFCLQDGTRLAVGAGEPPTIALGEPETVVRPHTNGEKMRFDIDNSTARNFPPNQTAPTTSFQPEPKKSNTALTVLLTVFGMLAIFGAVGAGAWFYFKNKQNEIVQNTAQNSVNRTTANDLTANSNTKKSPTPKPSVNANNANVSTNAQPAPSPPIDKEQIKDEVSESLDAWKSQSESRNLNAYMNSYADTVDYYKKAGASRSFIRDDKQRAFTRFDSINVDLSDITVTPDASGTSATIVFDKEWKFSGADIASSGKVRQQISMRKIGGKWLITGEKDLKVYYME